MDAADATPISNLTVSEFRAMIREIVHEALNDVFKNGAANPAINETMLASEDVLRREWDTPEEDEAWADL